MADGVDRRAQWARALPAGWWGAALLAASEATVFGSLIATYFYLRIGAEEWPLGGIEPPDVLVPTLLTVGLVLTSAPLARAAAAALADRAGAAWRWTALAAAAQCGYLAIQLVLYVDELETVPPDTNAYASAYHALLGIHHAHVAVGILLSLWVVARIGVGGGLSRYRVTTVRVTALYWHFVNAMAVLVVLTQISPRL